MRVDVGQGADRAVEGPRGDPLERGVARAVLPHAVDDVDALGPGDPEHLADGLGRVLEVGVDRHDVPAPGPGQTGGDGRLVAGVGPQPDHPQLRPLAAQPLEEDGRGVAGAVVDGEDLVGHAPGLGEGPEPLDEERQDVLLVEHRDDDGQLGGGLRHAARVRGRPRAPPVPRRDRACGRGRAPEYEIGGPHRRAYHRSDSSRSVPAACRTEVCHATVAPSTVRWTVFDSGRRPQHPHRRARRTFPGGSVRPPAGWARWGTMCRYPNDPPPGRPRSGGLRNRRRRGGVGTVLVAVGASVQPVPGKFRGRLAGSARRPQPGVLAAPSVHTPVDEIRGQPGR